MLNERELWASAIEFSGEPGGDAEGYISECIDDMVTDGEWDSVVILTLVRHRMRRLFATTSTVRH